MISDQSPVKEYYPVDFETDLNGKLQEWEAVVLIPFIDEVSFEFLLPSNACLKFFYTALFSHIKQAVVVIV